MSFQCSEDALYGVGQYYSSNGSIQNDANLYWLNNFDSIGRSYGNGDSIKTTMLNCTVLPIALFVSLITHTRTVTLYEEMVVNNWFIQMVRFRDWFLKLPLFHRECIACVLVFFEL